MRYFQRIGALVDLESSEFNAAIMNESTADIDFNKRFARSAPFFDPIERQRFRDGDVLPNIQIFLGKHRGSHGRNYGMTTVSIGVIAQADARHDRMRRKFIFSIEKVTCCIAIGLAPDANRNTKLQRLSISDEFFRLDPHKISSDLDIKTNLAMFNQFSDGSTDMSLFSPHS